MEAEGQWQTCVIDSEYEMYTEYPYPIRRKGSDKIIKECIDNTGYLITHLNKKKFLKHRIIALQFIPNENPEINNVIDHIDRNKLNNHINNLRWCSQSDNLKNKTNYGSYNYEYVEELPEDAIKVDYYSNHEIEDYYYNDTEDIFYFFNGINYRKLKICYARTNCAFVYARDVNNKVFKIYYSAFKKQYNLI